MSHLYPQQACAIVRFRQPIPVTPVHSSNSHFARLSALPPTHSEGKNLSKFEKKNRFFKFELKIFGMLFKKVLEN